ncbi:MAG: hypothetical protein LDL41_13630 [Coleofasciculus sp. S288]|nr:hypothetical protein [Coleofasciculus sp. S288]
MNSQESEINLLFFRGFWLEVGSRLHAYSKKASRNPKWFVMSVMGRFKIVRFVAKSLAKRRQIQNYHSESTASTFKHLDANPIATTLKKDGLYCGIILPKNLQQEILEFAHITCCYGDREPHLGFLYSKKEQIEKEIDRTFLTAQYFNTSLLCPAIKYLGSDPKLIEIATLYLGVKPVYTGSRLWWNFAVKDEKPYDPNKTITFFHYDLDDYACLRFFFYLTDVGCHDGPHVCVRSSHINKKTIHVFSPVKRRTDQDIINYYKSENIVTICGEAGFGFAEDTFCYHKATRPLRSDRLMLQIQFAIHDYGLHNDLKEPSLLKRII